MDFERIEIILNQIKKIEENQNLTKFALIDYQLLRQHIPYKKDGKVDKKEKKKIEEQAEKLKNALTGQKTGKSQKIEKLTKKFVEDNKDRLISFEDLKQKIKPKILKNIK